VALRKENARASSEVENYPYDPAAPTSDLTGLDRLRTISDRQLAQYLFELYRSLECRSVSPTTRSEDQSRENALELAKRALAGHAGVEAREVAEYLFLDDRGTPRFDSGSLRNFAVAMARLKQST
jgi:hypothetical protein